MGRIHFPNFFNALLIVGFSLLTAGCTLSASLISQEGISSVQQILIVEDVSAQSSKFDSLKKYKLISELPIKAESLSSSDLVQKGTAQGLIVVIESTASDLEFDLYVSVSAAPGTVVFELPAGSVEFQDGSFNVESSSPVLTSALAATHSRVALGEFHVCYSDASKKVRCFGEYYGGQTGRGDSSEAEQLRGTEVNASLVAGANEFVKVSGASYSSCGLSTAGILYCWGDNYSEELGVGTGDIEVLLPTPAVMTNVEGEKRFVDFDSSFESLCAISVAGDLYCSGRVEGTGSLIPVKVDLSGLVDSSQKVAQVSVGYDFVCGITTDGRLFCFGRNDLGQLGDGSLVDSALSVYPDVSGISTSQKFIHVSAGDSHACAASVSGELYCWGSNSDGQIGDGTQIDKAIPTAVDRSALAAGEKFLKVASAPDGNCGVSNLGKVYCFGDNSYHLTGNGSDAAALIPTAADTSVLASGVYVTGISAEEGRTCAYTSDSGLYCWGAAWMETSFRDNPAYEPQEFSTAVLPSGQSWSDIASSDATYKKGVALISSDGTGYVWGAGVPGLDGVFFDVTPLDTSTMTGSSKFKKISLGYFAMCGISFDDILHCMGFGASVGQGGVVTSIPTLTPVDTSSMTGATTFADVDLGLYLACGVATDGVGYCWGGEGALSILHNPGLGNGSALTRYKPHPIDVAAIPGSKAFTKILVSTFHVCGLMTDQKVYCWGNSGYNRSGHNSGNSVYVPQALDTSGMTGAQLFSDIYGSGETFCGISTDDIAYCWGDSTDGQLGNNSLLTSNTPVPVTVSGLAAAADPISVKGFPYFSCGILDAALNIYCWGTAGTSQLIENSSPVPVMVNRTGMSGNPVSISGGANLFVKTSTNKIYCIGNDCKLELARTKPTKQFYENF